MKIRSEMRSAPFGLLIFLICVATAPAFAVEKSNALDFIDFGKRSSEQAHQFNPGMKASLGPLAGVGALGQTFRAPFPMNAKTPAADGDHLTFILKVDPGMQNYLTVRLWGNDPQQAGLWLQGTAGSYGAIDWNGGPSSFPNRFYYETIPIPLAMTQGKLATPLTLYENNVQFNAIPARPVYSAYTHSNPAFVPDPNNPTGTPPRLMGQIKPITLTTAQIFSYLKTNREAIYKRGGYYDRILARQVPPEAMGAPRETWGLDLGTPLSEWSRGHGNATADQWRDQTGSGGRGAGYSTMPDELLSVLTSTYLLPPLADADGEPVVGLDHYHDESIIARIVDALDGSTYLQSSDGSYQAQPSSAWQGATSTPRASGHPYAGSTARGGGWSISLEGVDTGQFGQTIVQLLDEPTARPLFLAYLAKSFDADLNGGLMVRARAYERMLNNQIVWQKTNLGGGTVSQALFNVNGLYLNEVALQRLEAITPYGAQDSAFPEVAKAYPMPYPAVSASAGVQYLTEVTGVLPTSRLMGGLYAEGQINYTISKAGLGEAGGTRSGGYDGRYGMILPWLTTQFACFAASDPAVDPATLTRVRAQASAAVDAYAHFISPNENFNGVSDQFTLAQEDFITYRDPYNPNANGGNFNVAAWPLSADRSIGINARYATRSLYLCALYNRVPDLHFNKDLRAFEAATHALANVDPTTITPLPGEPGQPNSAWVDPQTGAAAVYYNGERLYVAANWRNQDIAGRGHISNLARIHDTTATIERAALVFLPCSAVTQQSDGNMTGGSGERWVVRYGNWLLMGNPTDSPVTLKIPSSSGNAFELISQKQYSGGAAATVNAGSAVVFCLQSTDAIRPGRATPPSPLQRLPNGVYTMTNAVSGMMLDNKGSTATNANLVQSRKTDQASQRWTFTSNSSGCYTIKNLASSLFMTDAGGEKQKPADSAPDQLWWLVPTGAGNMLVNQATGHVIEDPASSLDAGQSMNSYGPSLGLNQTWVIQ